MGTIKNAVYKVDNGVDFDEINFKTIASQVKTANGSDVEVQLADITTKLKWHIVEVWGTTAATGTTLVEYPAGSTKANCMMVAGYVIKSNGVANSISSEGYYYSNSNMSFTAVEAGRTFGVLLAKIF